jgi:tRNA A37 threonylcarbamoyladenosine modification protein TsaB
VATARGISQSLGVELVGVSSLLALSHAARAATLEETVAILPVIDARRSEVFVAVYDDKSELIAPHPRAPVEIGEMLEQAMIDTGIERWIAVGDGAVRYRDVLGRPNTIVPDAGCALHRIQASALCALGAQADSSGALVLPDYRRRPDVEIALEGTAS